MTTSEKELLPHQQRVVEETKELGSKVKNLTAFIRDNEVFKNLPSNEQRLLTLQLSAMSLYLDVLLRRIDLF